MGLHASSTRLYDKTVDMLSGGAKRRWTSAVAVTAVVATASATAWAVMDGNDPTTTSVTAAAAFGPASRTPTTALPLTSANGPAGSTTPLGAPSAASPLSLASPSAASPMSPGSPQNAVPATAGTSAGPAKAPNVRLEIETAAAVGETTGTTREASGEKAPPKSKNASKQRKKKIVATGRCGASYYDEGQRTANGERFNPNAMTAAHKTLRMGTKVRVTNPRNGKSVIVRINDRGPFIAGRCLDLSRAAFDAIGSLSTGAMTVKYAVFAR